MVTHTYKLRLPPTKQSALTEFHFRVHRSQSHVLGWLLQPSVFKILAFLVFGFSPYNQSVAQDRSAYDTMTLEELMDVDVVVTASKKPEDLFEAPLSTTIINRKEIEASGVTTIMEALRLAPGMIVRETTPDNYDIQIRGFDDVTKNSYLTLPFNTTTLVMIDNRIVYSYFTGGTFWEALPIDLQDVERIEIVRGPASALYGSNATTGVINIITNHAKKQGLNSSLTAFAGNLNSRTTRGSIGYNWNNRTRLTFSGHASHKERSFESYYNWKKPNDQYMALEDLDMAMDIVRDTLSHKLWDSPAFREAVGANHDNFLSQRKVAGNVFFNHQFSNLSHINIDAGIQISLAQKPGFLNFVTPLSINTSQSVYGVLRFKSGNSFGQFSATSGSDKSNYKFNSYSYQNFEGSLEYLYEHSRFSLRPGLGYKHLNYVSPLTNGLPFHLSAPRFDVKEDSRIMKVASFSLLSEWFPYSKLRLIGGLRLDHFNINENVSVNYELATTYRLNKNNLLRFAHSRATRSPFFFDTYLNTSLRLKGMISFEGNSELMDFPVDLNLRGSADQKYLTNTNNELAWRKKLNRVLSFDFELFDASMTHLIVSNLHRDLTLVTQFSPEGLYDSVYTASGKGILSFENFDITPHQFGATFMLSFSRKSDRDFSIFGTLQKTKLSGRVSQEFITTSGSFDMDTTSGLLTSVIHSWTNPTLWSENVTPGIYGGFILNLPVVTVWNISLNGYYSASQTFGGLPFFNVISDFTGEFWDDYDTLPPYFSLNMKLSREFENDGSIYIAAKNLLSEHKEFGYSDPIGSTFYLGATWNY